MPTELLAVLPLLLQASAPAAGEPRLKNLLRLTSEGANAEAYWSADGKRLIFQSTRPPYACDQIFSIDADGSNLRLLSTGKGRTTCGWFFPDGRRFLYSSTHLASPDCPPVPPRSHDPKQYTWPILPTYDLFVADLAYPSKITRLTEAKGYDAEATMDPAGARIVFTSTRDGDIEIYSMAPDGSDVKRLTTSRGYDGGAVFSPDGKRLVFRADELTEAAEIEDYEGLLAKDLVRPTRVEIYTMNADGTARRRLTRNGAANFAPCFFPDGRRILFSSNFEDPERRRFHLYTMRDDGTGLEKVTSEGSFNSFPMFSRDGRRLVFISNRYAQAGMRLYDVCVADWAE
jgi:TolB protein